MLNITDEQLCIALTYSLICKPKASFALSSRKALKYGRKVSPSNLSLIKGLSLQCRTRGSKENLCVSVLVWYAIPMDHNLIYTLKCARQPAQTWENLALSPLSVPCLNYSGVILSSSIVTHRKGIISKGTLVPTEQSKWHLWAWHADTAVPVCCRIWALTTNCSWGWLRTFKTESILHLKAIRLFLFMQHPWKTLLLWHLEETCREIAWDARMCVYTHVFIHIYPPPHIYII